MAIHYQSISIEFRYNDTVGMTGKYQCIQTIDIHSVNSRGDRGRLKHGARCNSVHSSKFLHHMALVAFHTSHVTCYPFPYKVWKGYATR